MAVSKLETAKGALAFVPTPAARSRPGDVDVVTASLDERRWGRWRARDRKGGIFARPVAAARERGVAACWVSCSWASSRLSNSTSMTAVARFGRVCAGLGMVFFRWEWRGSRVLREQSRSGGEGRRIAARTQRGNRAAAHGGKRSPSRYAYTARRAERWTDSCEPDWGVHGSGGVLCRLLDARNADDEPPTIWRYQQ